MSNVLSFEPRRAPELPSEDIISAEAVSALNSLAAAINYSPNNPGYLTSERHAYLEQWLEMNREAIATRIAKGLGKISFEAIEHDIRTLNGIMQSEQSRNGGKSTPVALFEIPKFLYAGVPAVEPLDSGGNTISDAKYNLQLVDHIAATAIRHFYLQNYVPDNYKVIDPETVQALYNQNNLSALNHAYNIGVKPTEIQPVPLTPVAEDAPVLRQVA